MFKRPKPDSTYQSTQDLEAVRATNTIYSFCNIVKYLGPPPYRLGPGALALQPHLKLLGLLTLPPHSFEGRSGAQSALGDSGGSSGAREPNGTPARRRSPRRTILFRAISLQILHCKCEENARKPANIQRCFYPPANSTSLTPGIAILLVQTKRAASKGARVHESEKDYSQGSDSVPC